MKKKTASKLVQKSAAEFFAEHQQIAGFDNPAKSLFTTIREFVENSLDAAESENTLPDIELTIVEFTEDDHNLKHGIHTGKAAKLAMTANVATSEMVLDDGTCGEPIIQKGKITSASGNIVHSNSSKEQKYYHITCKDNGCGMQSSQIGESFGRVLSGSKHGVRQTRGKYGLGAKMALIWGKKSSGLPITVKTSSSRIPGSPITTTVLDIDIHRNEPIILSTKSESNRDNWHGLEISLTILGNWSNCRAKVLQYLQQLAVITPYATFSLSFQCPRDPKKSLSTQFVRRSEQMPVPASETSPHPRSLNNITLTAYLQESKSNSMIKFLTRELSGISPTIAAKVVSSLKLTDIEPRSLSQAQTSALLQILRDEKSIKDPNSEVLSPAGEYNLRLGVLKELQPKMVATFTDKPSSHEGHAFIVEAAVSLGGPHTREGINVYRFANRIPLLFETGADVVTQVATKKISWNSYHIDPKKDNIGVFVSIVSTKVPFKGTSKEYIGDDVLEMHASVRRALQGCCQQLRVSLALSIAKREQQERRKTLVKYIPDISRALATVLLKMKDSAGRSVAPSSATKRKPEATLVRMDSDSSKGDSKARIIRDVAVGTVNEALLASNLNKAVLKFEDDCMQGVSGPDGSNPDGISAMVRTDSNRSTSDRRPTVVPVSCYLTPRTSAVLPTLLFDCDGIPIRPNQSGEWVAVGYQKSETSVSTEDISSATSSQNSQLKVAAYVFV